MIGRFFDWLWDWNDYPMLVLVAALLVSGCAHVPALEPALPFPTMPSVLFTMDPTGDICVSQADANLLNKWFQKIDEFEAARQRLLKGQ